jgi:hypothetical protein
MISISLSVKLTGIVSDAYGGGVVTWILDTGFWDDGGVWDDSASWID